MPPYNIKISCSTNRLLEIRKFISEVLEAHNYPEIESHKLILAVDEVCANLIIHSNDCNPASEIELSVDFRKNDAIIFDITDKGVSFDMNKYQEPELKELVSTKRKGGLGLMLVKRIMDKIEFKSEKNANICRLIKLIN
ncbi:MAG: ATP-binding protein [Cyclobacteriaceae bacterium]